MLTKKKVLFIIWSFTYGGGAERILANIVNNLDADKYDIEVLEYLHSDRHQESINSNVKLLKPIIDETQNDILSKLKKRIINEYAIMHCPGVVRRLFLNRVYDVEISFNYMIPTFLLDRRSSLLVSWIHSSIEDLKDNSRNRIYQKKYLEKVDNIIAISKKTTQSIISVFPEYRKKIIEIYNGYDFKRIYSLSNEEELDDFDLLFCNRLEERKNPILFLEIIKVLESKGISLSVKILGSGPLLNDVENFIKINGLKSRIELCGYQHNPYPYFKKARIFCLTSSNEGFPTSVVESMVLGRPFVSTPVAGIEELACNGKCGYVANTPEEFAESIEILLMDDNIYGSMSKCCSYEVKKYSLTSQISEINKLLY